MAVSIDVTTEVRWFFDSSLPTEVLSWFTKADTVGLVEDRWDSYRVDDLLDTGVKHRFGATLELKRRLERPKSFMVGENGAGWLELWQRWSPADDRVDLRESATWVNVDKTVIKRRFDAHGRELVLSEKTRAMNGHACDAEIVALSVDSRPAWGFAFAVFGPLECHHHILQAAWDALMAEGPVPRQLELNSANSCGYPEWLTRVGAIGEPSENCG